MIQPAPMVTGPYVEMILQRGWITVLLPIMMRCVPVKDALSEMTALDEMVVGGLGGRLLAADDALEVDMMDLIDSWLLEQ